MRQILMIGPEILYAQGGWMKRENLQAKATEVQGPLGTAAAAVSSVLAEMGIVVARANGGHNLTGLVGDQGAAAGGIGRYWSRGERVSAGGSSTVAHQIEGVSVLDAAGEGSIHDQTGIN